MIKSLEWAAYEECMDRLFKAFRNNDIAEQIKIITLVSGDGDKPWTDRENDLLWGAIIASQKAYKRRKGAPSSAGADQKEDLNQPTFTAKKEKPTDK